MADEERRPFIKGKRLPPPVREPLATSLVPPEAQKVLDEYADVMPDQLPLGDPVERETDHEIELEPNFKPPGHRIFRNSPLEDAELRKQLEAYLKACQIEPAKSPFGAGVLFASKKGGKMRMCIDYRALNKITKKDHYPLPRIDELLDNVAGAQWFTKLDPQQGYHQILIKAEYRSRTAFNTVFSSA